MQTYITESKKPDGRRPAPSPELRETEPAGTGNISLGGERSLDLPETLHARVQAQFGFSPQSIRVRESAQVSDIGAKATPVTPIPVSSAPVQGFFGRKKSKKSDNELHDEFLNYYDKNIDSPFETYYDLVGKGGLKGFDNRLVTAYTRGLDKEQQIEMWKDIQSGKESKKAPHLQRIFQRMLKANADLSDKNVMTDDYVTNNLTKSLDMTDDITMTQNFLDVNKDFKPKEHEQKLLDETKTLGGSYGMYVMQALKSHGMLMVPDTIKEKRIMNTSDSDTQMIMDSSKMVMDNNVQIANKKDESGRTLFDKARAAKKTYNKADSKYKRGPSKRFNERASQELELMKEFSIMHNLKTGGRANDVDPRQVMNIMNVVSGGKGMKGRKLKNFMKDLGGSDMEKKKPILDKFFKNMSNDVLNFDKRMMDEDYIEGNIDKVQNFLGANSAYNNMKNQKALGYDLDSKQENIIDKSSPFSAMYSGYVHALLSSKHNLKKANDFGDVPREMVGGYKEMAQSQFGGIKAIQKKHKKPWWKLW